MPKMTGDELSTRILSIRKNTPIILCTGYNAKFSKENAQEIGISRYINKPVTGQELSTLIRDLLDKK
jgi:CheY-like chemotaxis protein